MITIVAVNTTGMFSYGHVPTININNRGCVFLRGVNEDDGGSNGSGKSSFLNSIKEILLGKNDSGKSGPNVVNKHKDWNNGMFGVVWLIDHFGTYWRIMSIRKWKDNTPDFILSDGNSQILMSGQQYTGTDIFVEWWDGNYWIDARPTATKDNKSMTDAQTMVINDVLRMTYEQFSAYVCLGQKAESDLVSGTSGKREKIIQAVVDVSVWSKAADVAKDAYTQKQNEQSNVEHEISGMKSALNTIHVPSEEEINQARIAVESAREYESTLKQNLMHVNQQLIETHQMRNSLNAETIDQEIDLLKAEEKYIFERFEKNCIVEEDPKLAILSEDVRELNYSLSSYNNSLVKYRELGEGDCGECGQTITGEYLQFKIQEFESKKIDISNQINNLNERIQQLESEHERKVKEAENNALLKKNEELYYWQQKMDELENRKQQYNNLGTTIQNLEYQYNQINQQISMQPMNIQNAENNLNSLLSKVDEKNNIQNKLDELNSRNNSLIWEIDHLKWVERNLKKLRIQEYESSIERLNQLLADRLWEMWGNSLQARFVTATSTTRGSKVKSGLEFIVDTPNKSGIPIELYSGGEKKVIIVAVFGAMIDLSIERGSGVNMAAIDEIDEHLDDLRADRLVDAIGVLAQRIPTCLIISHNKRVQNTINFDDIWTVRKNNEMTTIEVNNQDRIAA